MSPNVGSYTFHLHGVTCRLEAVNLPFLRYAQAFLTALDGDQSVSSDITARLYWNTSAADKWAEGSAVRWGRRLLQAGERLLQAEVLPMPGLQLEVQVSTTGFAVDGYYRPLSLLQKLGLGLNALGLGSLQERVFSALCYYLVYFPLIYHLEYSRGWRLLHAAAVSLPEGDVCFSGLPGSGKTTLALALLAEPGARLLADNLLLTDGERVFACPEAVRLSRESRELLPSGSLARLGAAGRRTSHGRSDYLPRTQARSVQARPGAFYFLSLGDELRLAPMETGAALSRLAAFDWLAKEVNAYRQFAAPLDLLALRKDYHQGALSPETRLLSHVRCFSLQLQSGGNMAAAVEQVKATLAGEEQARLISQVPTDEEPAGD